MDSLFIYISIFTIAAILLNKGRKQKKILNPWSILALIVLVIFAAGRFRVGTDYFTYIQIFERYKASTWLQMLQEDEILFSLTAKLTYMLGGRVLTFGFYAILSLIPVYVTIHRYYPKVYGFICFMTFFFFYFAFSFNIMRQYIAISLIFWGMQYVFDNKPVRFFLVILMATGFHLSAPLAGLIWFLWDHDKHRPLKTSKKLILILLISIIIMNYSSLIDLVTGNISEYDRYASYSEFNKQGNNRDFYLQLFEFATLSLSIPFLKIKDKRIDMMVLLLFISILIGFTGFTHPQVKRFALYYAVPAKTLLFGYLPSAYTQNSKNLVSLFICLYAIFNFVLVAYFLEGGNLIPYQFDILNRW